MRSLSHNGRFVVRPGIACHGRYGEPETGAPAFLRLDADMPAHLLDDALRDRKPQPGALRKAVEFDETVENSAQMLFGDAFSRILDVEQQVPGLPAVAQRDGALLGEFHRIVDKIGDDLQQPVLVPDDAALRLMIAEKQFDGLVLHLEAQRTHRLLAHAVDVEHAVIELERSGLDLRKVEDIGYQFEQQVVILLDNLHVLAALRDIVGFGQQVREPHDGIERRTYLVAHIGQEGRFQAVADLGLVLGFDQALLRLLEFRDIEIDAYHLDLRGVGIQRVAHHVDARPPVLAVAEPDPQVEREAVRLVGLDAPDLPEYSLAVFGVDMVVDADHLRHGGVALLAQVAVPLRHGIPVAGHQVEAGVPHLAEAAHQRERTFELLQSVVGFVDLGVVDIQHQEVDQFAVHVVQHGHLGIYLHAAFLAGGIVAAQPVERIIKPEGLLLPVAHVAADLLGHDRVLEKIDPQHILLRRDAEDVEVFGVDVDQAALFVIKLHPDLDVVENIAQHFFAVEQRLVGIAHFGSIGKEADHLVGPGRIEDGVYPAFRDLVKGVAFDESVAAEHLRKSFQILLHIQPQFGNTPADIGFALGTHDLVGGVVGIQHQQVDGFPLLVTDDPQLGIPQGHVVVEALEVLTFGLRLALGALQFDTEADDIDQRRKPLEILARPSPGPVHDVDAGISPHLVAREERHGDQRLDVLHGQHLALAESLVGQFVERRDDYGLAVGDALRPPGHLVHRNTAYQLLFPGDILGRDFVGAII